MPFRYVDIDEDNDTEEEEDPPTDEDEDDSLLKTKINITNQGTVEAIKTDKEKGVMKNVVMKLDYYIEKDKTIEGLDLSLIHI